MRRILLAVAATAAMASFAHAQTATPAPANPAVTAVVASEIFVIAQPTDVLSSNLVGLKIVNPANETIGDIKDLIISGGELSGYVVSVGGFLGMGERHVIVRPSALQVIYNETDKKWSATMDTTKDALKAAPEFKYEGRWAL